MSIITTIEDLRQLAKRRVPRMFYDYADAGSWTESTYRANSDDFAKIKFRQRVAVNLSARQFMQPDLTERITGILKETGLEAEALELEVTESMVMHDPQRAAVILERLKDMGVAIAIDDFGTGYSSLSYLKRFPIDYIKIDQSFVRGIPLDAEDVGITNAIIAMAKTLDVKLIAEGVDNAEQLAFLKNEGCNEGQGYLISVPMPAEGLRRFLRTFADSGPSFLANGKHPAVVARQAV